MHTTSNSPLQAILISALVLLTVVYFYREAAHTEELDKVHRALAFLKTHPPSLNSSAQSSSTLKVDMQSPSSDSTSSSNLQPHQDLVLYSFRETVSASKNLHFFIQHALHAKADFIFIINGEHTQNLSFMHSLPNVRIVERENRCLDLGAYHEVLTTNDTLIREYKRFILVNDSVRGPFIPSWAANTCWSDAYWDKLDSHTKLVGMTYNCANNGATYPSHLQSMILASDRSTLVDILLPNMKCYADMLDAVMNGETKLASFVRDAGYEVYAMEGRFGAHAGATGKNGTEFLEWCVDEIGREGRGDNDVLYTGSYEGTTIHPYETVFAKTNRPWDDRDQKVIDLLTEHVELSGYSSYDSCK